VNSREQDRGCQGLGALERSFSLGNQEVLGSGILRGNQRIQKQQNAGREKQPANHHKRHEGKRSIPTQAKCFNHKTKDQKHAGNPQLR
jgi:hypothetical protein